MSALGVTRRVSFARWFAEALSAGGFAERSRSTRGAVVLRPHGFAVWELIRDALNARIREAGALNVYFPLLMPLSTLSHARTHVAGFAGEVAIVTHTRLAGTTAEGSDDGGGVRVDPTSQLAEPYVVRPTSECIITHTLARSGWLRSRADLPMVLNQWANVVRWERRPRLLTRNTEFLWQEGHGFHADAVCARTHTHARARMYADFFEQVLAIPVVSGSKSPGERFAGAVETLTCETIVQNGWALQSATSHYLGTHFTSAFGLSVPGAAPPRPVHSSSFGASTRMMAAAGMAHGDDAGMVLPPGIAPVQVVVTPIPPGRKRAAEAGALTAADVMAAAARVVEALRGAGLRVKLDDNVHDTVGARFSHWERMGVPVRLVVGERDLRAGRVTAASRVKAWQDDAVPLDASLPALVHARLASTHAHLLATARAQRDAHIHRITHYEDLLQAAKARRAEAAASVPTAGGVATASDSPADADAADQDAADVEETAAPAFLVPWHEDAAEEQAVRADTKYTLRCYPDAAQSEAAGRTCFKTGRPATHMALFARAF